MTEMLKLPGWEIFFYSYAKDSSEKRAQHARTDMQYKQKSRN